MMDGSGLSVGDAMALAKNSDGFLEGNGIIILILFFLIFGFGNGGFGGNNAVANYATQQDVINGFDFNRVDSGLRGLDQGLCQVGYANLQQTNELQAQLAQNGFNIQSQLAQNGFNMQQCCCETNRNIDSVKFENCQNTCAITNAIHQEGEQTRGLITANVMQELRDQLQMANNQLSNQAQTTNIISALRPVPIPSYITCSPYQAQMLPFTLNGSNSGCNC
jgi:hypothetical protein